MVAAEVAAPGAPAEGVNQEEGGGGWMGILRMVVLWYGINKVTTYFWTGKTGFERPEGAAVAPAAMSGGDVYDHAAADGAYQPSTDLTQAAGFDSNLNPFHKFSPVSPDGQPLPPHTNLFPPSTPVELLVYVSEASDFDFERDADRLVWSQKDLTYDFVDESERKLALNVSVTDHVRRNGTVYAHVFFTQAAYSANPSDARFNPLKTVYKQLELITYRPREKKTKRRNLLQKVDAVADDDIEDVDDPTYVAHWKPTLIVNAVCDQSVYARGTAPLPFIGPHMQVDPVSGRYLPIVWLNDFWVLEDHLVAINATLTTLPLELTYYPITLFKFGMYNQMGENFKNQQRMGTGSRKDADAMKKLFVETNPYLLGVTVVVSILHTVFDMLAFKNDVSFWRKQKSMEGLSLRTVVLNAFFHLVIFLYLVDNDTSWMILFSSGLGVVLDIWKIQKAVKVSWDAQGNMSFKGEESYDSSTAEHDRVAVAHVSYVMYPLLVGYAAYQLLYSEHKSWYSWVLSSLTSFVYAFGFIMMTPQLYINYKLKSVAHLPWRAMVYKSLNTFIDDLFAFVITMPMMHRLACFRDDIIFFVYLYQRWIYRVDKSRVNEFGQGGDDEDQAPKELPAPGGDDAAATAIADADADAATADDSEVTTEPSTGPVTRRRAKLDKK
ncbi:Aste57867_9121 [Aphanomyces stellatus]|uniref:Aste57867_9121 protein n=1 Tax=Aphanomyces stellatus TaxID=120398 RepID=A0A485KM49_9STRA|nr:hypothetical protein As57867_009085 [Aphanomyces stellatus]VFT86005.1 Aste57867_9121 [Aphanomyces stellatus]